MSLLSEPKSRRAWRREVAAHLVKRVDSTGHARFVGHTLEARREMLKVARLLPPDVVAEIFADPRHPTRTYMEISLIPVRPSSSRASGWCTPTAPPGEPARSRAAGVSWREIVARRRVGDGPVSPAVRAIRRPVGGAAAGPHPGAHRPHFGAGRGGRLAGVGRFRRRRRERAPGLRRHRGRRAAGAAIETDVGSIEFTYARRPALAGVRRRPAGGGRGGRARRGRATEALADADAAAAAAYVIDADAVRPDGSLDLEAERAAEWGLASDVQDLDPAPETARAADLRAKSQRLVGLTAFLIAAALFLTLAEVSRNPRIEALYWHGGVAVLAVAVVLLAVVEAL